MVTKDIGRHGNDLSGLDSILSIMRASHPTAIINQEQREAQQKCESTSAPITGNDHEIGSGHCNH